MLAPIITAPTELPITLAQVKEQAFADFCDDDMLLNSYICAAVGHLDGWSGIMGRAIMPQDVIQQFGCFEESLYLPYGPALSITSVTYYDTDNVQQTATGYALLHDSKGSFICHDDWPDTYDRKDAVTVNYRAGYADAASVPKSILHAISMLAATWYCNREGTAPSGNPIPFGVHDLLAPHRRVLV